MICKIAGRLVAFANGHIEWEVSYDYGVAHRIHWSICNGEVVENCDLLAIFFGWFSLGWVGSQRCGRVAACSEAGYGRLWESRYEVRLQLFCSVQPSIGLRTRLLGSYSL